MTPTRCALTIQRSTPNREASAHNLLPRPFHARHPTSDRRGNHLPLLPFSSRFPWTLRCSGKLLIDVRWPPTPRRPYRTRQRTTFCRGHSVSEPHSQLAPAFFWTDHHYSDTLSNAVRPISRYFHNYGDAHTDSVVAGSFFCVSDGIR